MIRMHLERNRYKRRLRWTVYRKYVIQEVIESEEIYVNDLKIVI
jgi:hypothetical protein